MVVTHIRIVKITKLGRVFERDGADLLNSRPLSRIFGTGSTLNYNILAPERSAPAFSKTLPTFAILTILNKVTYRCLKISSPFFWDTP